jgi:hypothetical protein
MEKQSVENKSEKINTPASEQQTANVVWTEQ